ncbi:MAG TPA: class I tRNA ligase family protein, partial [bacterium]|nr:class I tRNA ligase family protein [bacterium]
AMMELINSLYEYKEVPEAKTSILREAVEALVRLMGPFTPHIADEMWSRLGKKGTILDAGWPACKPELLKSDMVEIPIQANGKLKTRVTVPVGLTDKDILDLARKDANIQKYVNIDQVQKVIWIKDKLANFILKP